MEYVINNNKYDLNNSQTQSVLKYLIEDRKINPNLILRLELNKMNKGRINGSRFNLAQLIKYKTKASGFGIFNGDPFKSEEAPRIIDDFLKYKIDTRAVYIRSPKRDIYKRSCKRHLRKQKNKLVNKVIKDIHNNPNFPSMW